MSEGVTVTQSFDVQKVRNDFPTLSVKAHGQLLVYLDNGATTQKPNQVIDRMTEFLKHENATIHRGVYELSQKATIACDQSRETIRQFLNAGKPAEIIFTRGATEAVNLVAAGYGRKFIEAGDEIVISTIEHHANIVPWQQLCKEKGAILKVIPVNDDGELVQEEYEKLLSSKTKIVALTHISNALGTVNPVKEMTEKAHAVGAVVLLDGAQAVPHQKVDVRDLNCDFYVFSGHKIYGPTGIGVLYGKMEHLEAMDPYQTGGEMIESVSFEKTTFAKPPEKFEAGTPAIVEMIGLGEAIKYVSNIGLDVIYEYEHKLLKEATEKLSQIEGLRIVGQAKDKASLVSFVFEDIHPHDVGTLLDGEGIAVRTGHHCAQPTMVRFQVPATTRASFAFYNTSEEIDRLVEGLQKVKKVFAC